MSNLGTLTALRERRLLDGNAFAPAAQAIQQSQRVASSGRTSTRVNYSVEGQSLSSRPRKTFAVY